MSSYSDSQDHIDDAARAAARERLARRRASRREASPVDEEALDLAGIPNRSSDGEDSLFAANKPGAARGSRSGGNPYSVSQGDKHRAAQASSEQRSASDDRRGNRAPASSGQASSPRSHSSSGISGVQFVMAALSSVSSVPRSVMVCVIAVLIAFACIVAFSRSCSSSPETASPAAVVEEAPASDESADDEQPAAEAADFSNLPASLDSDTAAALQAKADDPRIVKIVNNAAALASTGTDRQIKMLELAANDPQAVDYVADFPQRYPSVAAEPYKGDVQKGTIPDLKQWDQRWGYVEYCGAALGSTGCCPTSLSMVYMGLTGNTDKSPADMAALATADGYAVDEAGTIGNFLVDEAPRLGLSCQKFNPSSQSLTWFLSNGFVVVVNVGAGDFTDSGHFFVARGVASDGTIEINDPYSSVNTAKTWDADVITGQSIAMYAFKAA